MIVKDKIYISIGNFAQFLSFDDVDNGISQLELGEKNFPPYERHTQDNIQLRDR